MPDERQLKIRLPKDLHEELVKSAKANHRSLASEVAYRLAVAYCEPRSDVVIPAEYIRELVLMSIKKAGAQAHKEKNKA